MTDLITVPEVKAKLLKIKAVLDERAAQCDEDAHIMLDDLYETILEAIAQGNGSPKELAETVLQNIKWDWSKCYA